MCVFVFSPPSPVFHAPEQQMGMSVPQQCDFCSERYNEDICWLEYGGSLLTLMAQIHSQGRDTTSDLKFSVQ